MRALVNLAVFVGGIVLGSNAIVWALGYRAEHPYPDTTIYDDDNYTVVQLNDPAKKRRVNLAYVVNKHN